MTNQWLNAIELSNIKNNNNKNFQIEVRKFSTTKVHYHLPCRPGLPPLQNQIRGKVINCRDNHHSSHQSIICRLCGVTVETQEHIANCPKVRGDREVISFEQFYAADIDANSDLTDLVDVKNRYRLFQDLVSGTQEVVEDTMDFVHT